jgi:hypothetical protein
MSKGILFQVTLKERGRFVKRRVGGAGLSTLFQMNALPKGTIGFSNGRTMYLIRWTTD